MSQTLRPLYISHFLSVLNARTFEFAALLFLLAVSPHSLLLRSSLYALMRSLAAFLLSSTLGACIDRTNRLVALRRCIIAQRASVAASCAVFAALLLTAPAGWVFEAAYAVLVVLACVEKLVAGMATVAVERDWVVTIVGQVEERRVVNAVMRRIDLACKLGAPVVVAAVQAWSNLVAVAVLGVGAIVSAAVEYGAALKVYEAVPALAVRAVGLVEEFDLVSESASGHVSRTDSDAGNDTEASNIRTTLISYITSPVFAPSFSLSLLYLTVLSTGVQYQAYMLSVGFTGLTVSLLRLVAVISELAATCLAPVLMKRIGDIRAGLWSINWQVFSLAGAVLAFVNVQAQPMAAGLVLTAGIVLSRVGLWGFDLAVQNIVQEVIHSLKSYVCLYEANTRLCRERQSTREVNSHHLSSRCKTCLKCCLLRSLWYFRILMSLYSLF
jgi:iron-regulated transporter 1